MTRGVGGCVAAVEDATVAGALMMELGRFSTNLQLGMLGEGLGAVVVVEDASGEVGKSQSGTETIIGPGPSLSLALGSVSTEPENTSASFVSVVLLGATALGHAT